MNLKVCPKVAGKETFLSVNDMLREVEELACALHRKVHFEDSERIRITLTYRKLPTFIRKSEYSALRDVMSPTTLLLFHKTEGKGTGRVSSTAMKDNC